MFNATIQNKFEIIDECDGIYQLKPLSRNFVDESVSIQTADIQYYCKRHNIHWLQHYIYDDYVLILTEENKLRECYVTILMMLQRLLQNRYNIEVDISCIRDVHLML